MYMLYCIHLTYLYICLYFSTSKHCEVRPNKSNEPNSIFTYLFMFYSWMDFPLHGWQPIPDSRMSTTSSPTTHMYSWRVIQPWPSTASRMSLSSPHVLHQHDHHSHGPDRGCCIINFGCVGGASKQATEKSQPECSGLPASSSSSTSWLTTGSLAQPMLRYPTERCWFEVIL